MDYVILDLEWDSVYLPREKRFVNQILQIGAVRLDSSFNTVGRLCVTICSAVSKRVSGRFAKLTGITSEIMREGIPFEEAVRQYNAFADGAEVTMTWSNSDLYTILENQDLLLSEGVSFKFDKYLDLQKLVQGELRKKGYESKNQISLEAAAEFLNADTAGIEFHNALDDCLVCAELFKLCYTSERFDELLKDTADPDFYGRLRFKAYIISDIHDRDIDREELNFECPECGGVCKRLNAWKFLNRWFGANFKCKSCGFKFNGRLMFKKTFDGVTVRRKVCEYKEKKTAAVTAENSLNER